MKLISIVVWCLILSVGTATAQSINENILFASARGELEKLDAFLRSDSVDLGYRYENGYSSLDYAIERNHRAVFKRLIQYYSSHSNAQGPEDRKSTELMIAILDADTDRVRNALEDGADPGHRHVSGYYPLSVAVRWEETGMIDELLTAGADVNAANSNRYNTTPLMELTRNGNVQIAELLLNHGSLIDAVDVNGDPAMNWAVYFGQTDLVKLLLDRGARIDLKGSDSGDDALAIAIRMKLDEIIALLKTEEE